MKKTKLLYFLIALLPFIDLVTSIESKNGISLTIGTIVKGLTLVIAVYYLLFRCQSKYKKWNRILVIGILLYMVGYFICKPDLLELTYLKYELSTLVKLVYTPILFLALFNYLKEYGFNQKYFMNTMKSTLIIYTLLLLIPLCTGTAYNSYAYSYHGYVGWFYSANEVSIIMVLLLPYMYFFLDEKHTFNFLIALPIMYVMSSIGTKGALIGSLAVTILGTIFMWIREKGKLNGKTIGSLGILLISLIFFLGINTVTVTNVNQKVEIEQFEFIETPRNENEKTKKEIWNENVSKAMNFLLSNREIFYRQAKDIYEARYETSYTLFGMGYSNTQRIQNRNIDKLIEIDYLDVYFHAGLVGLLISIMPFIYVLVLALTNLVKRKLTFKENVNIIYLSAIICLALTAAGLSGHVLGYPSVTFYLIVLSMYVLKEMHVFDKTKLNPNKIQILALHLNTGGIEKVICSQANMLVDHYEVEILSLYNSHKKIPFVLNKKVKVTYLTDTISNRNEVINACKNFDVLGILKEGTKAIKILLSKNSILRKAILNSDAKVIISTRSEFTKVLTKYAQDEVIVISEEHNHHNGNKKYWKKVVKDNKKTDFLLPASQELKEFYEAKMSSRVVYVPNTIGDIPENKNTYSHKKLVSVGRLDPVKGYIDLIKIMNRVVKKDKEITLDIYGDGSERQELEELIHNYHLEKNVSLKGFVSEKELAKVLDDYSLFACTSLSESFGLAILEANSHGIPCILFDSAKGPLEFVNETNGVIISNRDLNLYAKKIIDLCNYPKKLKELGKVAYETSKKYSFDVCKDKLNEFIKFALENEKRIHTNVMFISSTGGHLSELLQLKDLFKTYKYEIITEKTETTKDLKEKYGNRVSYLVYGNKHSIGKYIFCTIPVNIVKTIHLYRKYKPDYIITTGAHSAVAMCLLGKLLGSKVIYIETFANINTKTLTGRILYPVADVFIVQWEEMQKLYPNAIVGGWIY